MKIRTRLSLWYATILIVSLALIGASAYNEIAEQMEHNHRRHLWEHALSETSEIIFQVGLPAIFLGLLGGWWITRKAGGLGPVLQSPGKFHTTSEFIHFFIPSLTGMVGFWATVALNIPDFTRYA